MGIVISGLQGYRLAATAEIESGTRHCEVVQFSKGYGFIQPQGGGRDVFVPPPGVAVLERLDTRLLEKCVLPDFDRLDRNVCAGR